MLLIKLNPRLCIKRAPIIRINRHTSTAVSTTQDEQPVDVKYPPILDLKFPAKYKREHEAKHERVKNVPTVEEKQIKINMPRYWGFRAVMYEEGKIYYNELPHAQYITRTHVVNESKLPEVYDNLVEKEKLDGMVKDIKDFFEDSLAFEIHSRDRKEVLDDIKLNPHDREDVISEAIAKQTNRILSSSVANQFPHLLETEVDFDPRIEAFWFAGGLYLHEGIMKDRIKRFWKKDATKLPSDRPLQYLGSPILQLRHRLPLKEILPSEECESAKFPIPMTKFDSRAYGHYLRRRHGTSIPGYWPGDASEFGVMSYHKRGYLVGRNADDDSDALKTQAVYANWAWLLGQASHQGFTTYNDVTYPLVNQAVITNGQWWSFCVYQLNTLLINSFHHDTNPKCNLMWMTEPMKLYETIENGKLMGVNDEVLSTLIKFYANKPEERMGIEMKPYVSKTEQVIADIEDDGRRNFVEDRYKHLMSNRPRHTLPPEQYHWEVIYKRKFETRPMDKKETPWDFGFNPYLRKLDEHVPRYIPKKLRPEGTKKRDGKWAKLYYP